MTVTTPAPIACDDLGTGDPALLFLPGWCGDRTVFDPLLPLTARHRRAIAMDLRDHGGSGRTEADFGTAEVVQDAIDLLGQAGVERVVPVGLSHAGWAAIELRRRLGAQRVPGIVLLDWMVLGPPPGFLDALAGLQRPEAWQEVRSELFAMWTSGIDVDALHHYVEGMAGYGFRHWRRAGREIAAAFAAQGTPLAALERLDTPCPTLHLYAQPGDDAVLAAQRGYAADHPWFRVHCLKARSHFPMFEVPQELAAAVEEFLCTLG
ncbi:alpha/beta hydrolase [Dactylosporangium sp. NPDC049140]|uniref:alpha/beta fold hydrolase n=1 Tax=Dactylosporangium sp. NPDC049140 TaxID=3155647 RepID=UPI0033E6B369